MKRVDGWNARLFAVLKRYDGTPFVWGASDCWCLVSDCIAAITGADFLGTYRGQYSSRLTAAGRIRGRGHRSMLAAVQAEMARIGGVAVPVQFARTGDVGLSFCNTLCVRTPRGFIARNDDGAFCIAERITAAWRIGD